MKLSVRALSKGGLIGRSRIVLATLIMVVATLVAPFSTSVANADTKADVGAINTAYYSSIFLRDCLVMLRNTSGTNGAGASRITQTRIDDGTFLVPVVGSALNTVSIGRTLKADDGIAHCDNTALVKSSLTAIGFANGGDFLKAIGYVTSVEKVQTGEKCGAVNYDCTPIYSDVAVYTINGNDTFNSTIMSKHPQADYAKYVAYLAIFNAHCKLVEPPTGSGDAVTYKKVVKQDDGSYKVVDTAAEFPSESTTVDTGNTGSDKTTVTTKYSTLAISNFDYQGQNTNCSDLLSKLDGLTAAVARFNNNHKSDPIGTTFEYTGNTANTPSVDCAANPTNASCDTGNSTCTVEGIGWIVCPVMNFMSNLNDNLYNFLATYFLQIPATIFSGSGDSGLYGAWNTFRGIANILFIIAFLIIVYSQITSVGINNYGIKKLLPKLIVAAILVNVSYYICQIAVDISNILGYGIKSLFDAVGGGVGDGKGIVSTFGSNPWGTIIGGALAVAGTVVLLLAISVPVLLAGLLSLLMVVIILITRQALVILLVAISPIAFVAWLLPNTEKWFKKWWEIFFSMLMLFPVIGLLYGAGALAASILGKGDFGDDGGVAKLAALGASVLPLALTIPVVQGALKATGALGAKLSGWSNKANAGLNKSVKGDSRLGRGVTNALAYRAQRRAIRQTKAGAKWYNRMWEAPLGGPGYSKAVKGKAESLENEEYEKQVKETLVGFSEKSSGEVLKEYNSGGLSEAQRAAAIEHIMAKGSFNERRALVESVDAGMSGKLKKRISDGVYSKGDQNIYGAGIGSKIMGGNIGGEDGLRQETLKNIEEGHVNADHLVQGEGSAKYLVDVAKGEKDQIGPDGKVVKDAAGNTVRVASSVAGSANAVTELSSAAAEARTNTRTKAQAVATAFASEFSRI